MKPFAIKEDIYWIGDVDYSSRDFHGYSRSPMGTTYNAYLIRDEKNVVFDTVKAESAGTMLRRLARVMEPHKVDYIVVNHLELDHSGALPRLVEACKPEKIFCSALGVKSMEGHFDTSGWPVQAVKTGDVISIGKRSIHFVEARMLHWPDSMFSYIPEEKLLIANDAFGQNIAASERYFDEIDRDIMLHSMKEYYHNIVQPFAPQVLKILEQVTRLGLDIEILAPDHGLIYRTRHDVAFALESYKTFALQPWKKKALIVYDTMWRGTEKMAEAIGEGLVAAGVPVRLMSMKANHHSAVMTELADCGALLVGSPTHNNGIMPAMADILTYMKGLRPRNKLGAAFGSFGWSGESVGILQEWLTAMGMDQPVEPVKCQFQPKHDTLCQCFAMGEAMGRALIGRCGQTAA